MSRTYTTVQGDMWDSIAFAQLGGVQHTDKLMRANPRYLGYYTFPAGVALTLPEVEDREAGTPPPWKQVVG